MAKKTILNILKYLAFFSIGIFIFWLVYRNLEIDTLKHELSHVNLWWLLVSLVFLMLSNLSRALRWNMLIRPLGHNPSTLNSLLAVLVMYLTNLALPRAGELARCTVLGRYERIPFTKLVGTVVVERFTDAMALFIFAFVIILSQWPVFSRFMHSHPDMDAKIHGIFSLMHILLFILLILAGISFLISFRKRIKKMAFFSRIEHLYHNFTDGLKAIGKLENKWYYIGHTVFIYIMWLAALYVVFLSYPPTMHLSIAAGMAAFVMGGLAMLAPVQGGIGPWHFMVYETLFIYGIDKTEGKVFALIAHTTTNLSMMIFGLAALLILPMINRKEA